ncbi:MAG: tetratricopeptide repeat protein [Planctomycetota bacterium]
MMRSIKPLIPLTAVLFMMLVLGACASSTSPYLGGGERQRDPMMAQRLTQEAGDTSDAAEAEQLLRRALAADLYHGPAHNNLGVLLLKRGELYEAAHEFEWARKLMPGHPDPRLNLGLVMERAGRVEEAIEAYESAREVYPGHMPAIQAIARASLRYGLEHPSLEELLEQVSLRGTSYPWREWARERRNSLPR